MRAKRLQDPRDPFGVTYFVWVWGRRGLRSVQLGWWILYVLYGNNLKETGSVRLNRLHDLWLRGTSTPRRDRTSDHNHPYVVIEL